MEIKFGRQNRRQWLGGISLASALLLSACGGGGTIPVAGVSDFRALPAAVMQQRATAYSPYRTSNRDTETITKTMIEQDLALLQQTGFGLIRLFDASDAVSRLVLEVIRERQLPIKVMLGMYVNPNAEAANQAELDRGIALAKAYPAEVVALSVGNEKLVYWSFAPIDVGAMVGYIRKVRAATTQPVTTDDNWAFFADAAAQGAKKSDPVLAEIDFVSMHSYPLLDTIYNETLWDWKQAAVPASQRAAAMMDAAVVSLKNEYSAVRSNLDALGHVGMPIVVGETGWKAAPSGGETQRASPVNQKMYFDRIEAWKAAGNGPATVVHFEAFDEPWKQGDDKWGLFTVDRKARCVTQSLGTGLAADSASCDPAQAAYWTGSPG
ncbi:glycosyl hydrolase family 17 protein [Amphibiibacter pelophylacis]|uniref:Glycosyl hydrolase family 17 protein n=1 Tax=Amphibiibacter pelophylacis TaxID=1799477 RepID=A0ACC6P2A1_9BURK